MKNILGVIRIELPWQRSALVLNVIAFIFTCDNADKSKYKSRSRYVSSSSEEVQPSVAKHRSSTSSGAQRSGATSDQDQPQHDPDPPYYREVALSDIPPNSLKRWTLSGTFFPSLTPGNLCLGPQLQ